MLAKLTYSVGKIPEVASPRDWFLAVAFATRDIIVDRWLDSTAGAYADGRKRVYYLSLEFLIGRLLFDAMTNLGIAEPMAEALHELGVNLTELAPRRAGRRARQRRPGTARRLLHGQHGDAQDRRARLRHPLRQRPVPPDHPRRLAAGDAGGLARQRQSVGIRAARVQLRDRLRRLGRNDARRGRAYAPHLASGGDGRSGRLRHADRRLARQACEHAAPVVGPRPRPVQARRVQRGRLCRRAVRHGARRGDLEGALSERRHPGRPGAAPQAGVLLRLRVAARPHSPPYQAAPGRAHARRTRRHPAQRHPSGDRRRRAHAHSDRPQRPRMGRGVDRSRRRPSPTPTTPCCPKRSRAGRFR